MCKCVNLAIMSKWLYYAMLFTLFALVLDVTRKSLRASISNTSAEGEYRLMRNGVPDEKKSLHFQTMGENSDVARVTGHDGKTKAFTMRSLTQGVANDGTTLDITGAYLVVGGEQYRRANDGHSKMLLDGAIFRP